MNRIIIGLVIAVIAACGFLGWRVNSLVRENAALVAERDSLSKAQNRAAERLKQTQATLRTREREIASQAAKLAEAQEGLKSALQAEKEWSDTDVPTEVQNALSGALRGLPDGVQHD